MIDLGPAAPVDRHRPGPADPIGSLVHIERVPMVLAVPRPDPGGARAGEVDQFGRTVDRVGHHVRDRFLDASTKRPESPEIPRDFSSTRTTPAAGIGSRAGRTPSSNTPPTPRFGRIKQKVGSAWRSGARRILGHRRNAAATISGRTAPARRPRRWRRYHDASTPCLLVPARGETPLIGRPRCARHCRPPARPFHPVHASLTDASEPLRASSAAATPP